VPSYFKGLINLRGRIISVIDLRQKLNLSQQKSESKRPCIIISELENMILGAIVDDVIEVVGVDADKIEKNLEIAGASSRNYVTGVARFSQAPLTLMLDMGKLLNVEELLQIKQHLGAKEENSSLKSA
jgi:purine-binding chemotaxis protein CheW